MTSWWLQQAMNKLRLQITKRFVTPGAPRLSSSFPVTPPATAKSKCLWNAMWPIYHLSGSPPGTSRDLMQSLKRSLHPLCSSQSSAPGSQACTHERYHSEQPVCWGPAASAQQQRVKELNVFCAAPTTEYAPTSWCPGQSMSIPLLQDPLTLLKWCPPPCYGQQKGEQLCLPPLVLLLERQVHDHHRAGEHPSGRAMTLKVGNAAVGDSLLDGNVIRRAN